MSIVDRFEVIGVDDKQRAAAGLLVGQSKADRIDEGAMIEAIGEAVARRCRLEPVIGHLQFELTDRHVENHRTAQRERGDDGNDQTDLADALGEHFENDVGNHH